MAERALTTACGGALCTLCEKLGCRCQGLARAARRARPRGFIAAALARQTTHLDIAMAFVRHATDQRSDALLADLATALPAKAVSYTHLRAHETSAHL
eukprot:5271514-Alexandrium_andersonii.AAC.1